MEVKAGTRFIHSTWVQCCFTVAELKSLPKEDTHILCKVTKVTKDRVYYRPIHTHGNREELGTRFYTEDFNKSCLKILKGGLNGKDQMSSVR